MKKKLTGAWALLICCLVCLTAFGCGTQTKTPSGKKKSSGYTLEERGLSAEEKTMDSFVQLDDIYFPEGLHETGLGLYIWSGKEWVHSDEGHQYFDDTKDTLIYVHGMGGNGTMSRPQDFVDMGYNAMTFMWGTYAGEDDFTKLVDKIWYRGCARWSPDNYKTWITDDICDVTVTEVFGAYYYEIMSAFPEYSGSCIHLTGFSYGGMLVGAITSLLTTAYMNDVLPAYMLPDVVTMLDPYVSPTVPVNGGYPEVPWLGETSPSDNNDMEVLYQMSLNCRKLGITLRMNRSSDPIALPAYSNPTRPDHAESYWALVDNCVYNHLDAASSGYIYDTFGFGGYFPELHSIGEAWFLSYYQDIDFYDTNATKTNEYGLCFNMPYDVSFSRCGAKYALNINGTLSDISDDTLTSMKITTKTEYENESSIEKAKISGFVYYDKNGNGEFDDRLVSHLSEATVTVKKGDKVIYEGTTTVNGYYEVEVDELGDYTVSVVLPKGYTAENDTATLTIVDARYQLAIRNFAASK